MPLASLFLLIFVDPVVSEGISKTNDKRVWQLTLCKKSQVNMKNGRPCNFLQSASPLCISVINETKNC